MEETFLAEMSTRSQWIRDYLRSGKYVQRFPEGHIRDSVYSYVNTGGKCLRPAVLLFCCGAVGGDETKALPAAAGIEMFHTWTLVHDDIIDRDDKRRGSPTVHAEFAARARAELGLDERGSEHYGTTVAIMTGDIQHGWAVSLFTELSTRQNVDPDISLYLIQCLDTDVLNRLMDGEMSDVQYSKAPMDALDEHLIIDALRKKTGAVYEFAGKAGAMIGLDTRDPNHKWVRALSAFAEGCGTAFQLQDDILGVVGDERQLGKPVGSDIREGKRTTIVHFALRNATSQERKRLGELLGNEAITDDEVTDATRLLAELGGIEETRRLAERYVADSQKHLDLLPPSRYRDLLAAWAEYVISRDF
jgi:geranylgeranyl diphosphate synthase type I